MTMTELLEQARDLPMEERRELIKKLVDTLVDTPVINKQHDILEFEGVGSHLRDMDAQEYVNQLRSEWDHRP
jgi:hypothetical protein